MPFFTEIPDATIDLEAATPVLSLGSNLLLNRLGGSTQFAQYDVDASQATTLRRGDDVSLVDGEGNPLLSGGTFAGTGTLSSAAASVGVPLVAQLKVQLNPINGSFVVDGEDTYFVSDQPLDKDHIGVKITGTILGQQINLANVNISDLGGVLTGPVLSAVQNLLDTLVVNIAYNPAGTLVLDDDDVFPCFTAGTLIDTPDGPVPVESLSVGDLVLTADHGPQPVRWIGRRRFAADRLAAHDARLMPVRIKAGALGPNMPSADLTVSPQHRILLRSRIAQRMFGTDEILVAAKQLLQIEGVERATDLAEVEYVHILFDRHEVVRANGTATESLYLGPQALAALPAPAVGEILAIFPELAARSHAPEGARMLASGRKARKLAQRHAQNGQPLVLA
ncbi:Hint domain-containing protein [Paracoccus sp. P2]|uniref:Hint domain-containing protein n=3 Tax=Paracoccus pantotrophus TaxID=82367 RepID=A0A7H9BPG9_PARPN|nr:Hint domain-containing protein [Paracoccus pantotrophus]MDF3853754.1 Hint domain-containing protein [Paracoccus pantotrophus]QLH12913.1 Hint domain-containing protein [Paracoccus pantotrophus]RDD97459.1 hemolysin [Paracoccus pantotrophus]RNI14703.1 hemolysin [Paracoccus pantotrophus]WGR66523.1 Hint domain-containing protein [Paracoccus pantotrophus]